MSTQYEFSFEATPQLGPAAFKCLMWKRGGVIGPIALVLLPLLLLVLASQPGWLPVAALLGGAALMLLIIAMLAIWMRRRMRKRFFQTASHREVRIVLDDEWLGISTAVGASRLPWATIERVWRCKSVVLFIYQDWQYVAAPASAVPEEALQYADARIRGNQGKRG